MNLLGALIPVLVIVASTDAATVRTRAVTRKQLAFWGENRGNTIMQDALKLMKVLKRLETILFPKFTIKVPSFSWFQPAFTATFREGMIAGMNDLYLASSCTNGGYGRVKVSRCDLSLSPIRIFAEGWMEGGSYLTGAAFEVRVETQVTDGRITVFIEETPGSKARVQTIDDSDMTFYHELIGGQPSLNRARMKLFYEEYGSHVHDRLIKAFRTVFRAALDAVVERHNL